MKSFIRFLLLSIAIYFGITWFPFQIVDLFDPAGVVIAVIASAFINAGINAVLRGPNEKIKELMCRKCGGEVTEAKTNKTVYCKVCKAVSTIPESHKQ